MTNSGYKTWDLLHRYSTIDNNRAINFAVVGCGRIAINHVKALLSHHKRANIVALCDINTNQALELKQKIQELVMLPEYEGIDCNKYKNIDIYDDIDHMLQNKSIDCVSLATPSGLHAMQAIKCANAHVHVVTEKPMATRLSDGLEMVKACDSANVMLFVIKQNRNNPTVKAVKAAIDDNKLGRIFSVACNVFWSRPQDYYDLGIWRGTWEFDGGAFMNQASHYVDLIEWLVGPIESVQSYTATLSRKIDAEDSGVMAFKYRNGALGTMNVSMLTYPKNLEGSITIIGETGTIKLGGVAVNEIVVWNLKDDAGYVPDSYQSESVYGFGHNAYYDNVINTLYGHSMANTDGRAGLKSLELLSAIYMSARDGKKISLPLSY